MYVFSKSHNATSVFFVDNSTLLSRSLSGIEALFDLVKLYCGGSGAKLNFAKRVHMPLNRRSTSPCFLGVKVLERGETVKFLGILVRSASN